MVVVAKAQVSIVCGAALSVAVPAAALAQQAGEATQSATDSTQAVVVTGKRAERQRDIAGNVSVVGGDDLEARSALDTEDVFRFVPGVNVGKGGADSSLVTIRGVNSAPNAPFLGFIQSPVAFFIDDVGVTDPHYFMSSPDLLPFDLQRVEVLRGPQGTLFGSASIGGAVRYVLNKPNLKTLEGAVAVGFNRVSNGGDGYLAQAMINAPIVSDKLALRAVVFDRKDGGYIDAPVYGRKDSNELGQTGARILARLRPTERLIVDATFLTQSTHQHDSSSVSPDPNALVVNNLIPSTRDTKFSVGSVQVNYDLGASQLTAVTGYIEKQVEMVGSSSRTTLLKSVIENRMHARSQELRLASKDPDAALSYVVGAFYQDARTKQQQDGALPDPTGPYQFYFDGQTIETALFGEAQYRLTPAFSLGAGLRFYRNKLDFFDRFVIPAFGYDQPITPSNRSTGVLPKVTAKYRFSPSAMVYGLYSQGYRNGGVNDNFPVQTTYKADRTDNYEAGVKWNPAVGVEVDATVFRINWKDVPATLIDPIGNAYFANVTSARSQGVELATSWTASASTRINASMSFTDAKTLTAFSSADGDAAGGTQLPNVAKTQAALQARHRFEIGGLSSVFAWGASYVGARRASLFYPTVIPAYTTGDVRLEFGRERWTLSTYVNNISDRRGVSAIAERTGRPLDYALIRPRTVGLTFRYDL